MQMGYSEGVHGGVYGGVYMEGVHKGVYRGVIQRGYPEGFPLATIDLVGDNRELGSLRPLVAPSNQ